MGPALFWHCCKVIDELVFNVIESGYISKSLLARLISPWGCPILPDLSVAHASLQSL